VPPSASNGSGANQVKGPNLKLGVASCRFHVLATRPGRPKDDVLSRPNVGPHLEIDKANKRKDELEMEVEMPRLW
jgi:hypothetical protein